MQPLMDGIDRVMRDVCDEMHVVLSFETMTWDCKSFSHDTQFWVPETENCSDVPEGVPKMLRCSCDVRHPCSLVNPQRWNSHANLIAFTTSS
jgi:hypothetical protein